MPDHDRTIAIHLGALLLDGIIPADLKVIESTIVSLRRAAAHVARTDPAQDRPRRAAEKGLKPSNTPIETPPSISPHTTPILQSSKKHDAKRLEPKPEQGSGEPSNDDPNQAG